MNQQAWVSPLRGRCESQRPDSQYFTYQGEKSLALYKAFDRQYP